MVEDSRAPATPGGLLLDRWWKVLLAGVLTAALAAATTGPSTGLDREIGDLVLELRGWPDGPVRTLTELGGGVVVLPLAALAAAVTWRRSPPLAAAILLAVTARYGVELLLKEAVGRERPAVLHLTRATGFSFPSGHVLGATIGWGTVVAAVRVATRRSGARRAAFGLWAVVVALVAFSRIYLGVHFFTDAVASLLVGLLVLRLVDVAAAGGSAPRACASSEPGASSVGPGVSGPSSGGTRSG